MAKSGRILVVDDEAIARKDLAARLVDAGYHVETAADAFKALGKVAAFAPHVVVTDLKMPGMGGIELASKLRALDEPPSVIVMTGFCEVPTAIEAIRGGAVDYLGKPLDFDKLVPLLDKTIAHAKLLGENRELRRRLRDRTSNIVGESPGMRRVLEIVAHVSPTPAHVLLVGESGTGKELIANAIHHGSQRASGPFVKLHCRALGEALLESELFGHERRAFADAHARKDGQLQLADGGTLVLDEIEAMPPTVQVKLLRYLQDHAFERAGGTETLRSDVRVIAAADCDLAAEVVAKRFRDDLYYRLSVVSIEMPPLRLRGPDIMLLAKHFLDRFATAAGKTFDDFTGDAIDRLVTYDWPGNVRELANVIERAVIFATGPLFDAKHLPPTVRSHDDRGMPRIPGATLAELTRYAILETLEATGGSTTKAAEILGISARTIQYKLHEYNDAPASDVDVVSKTS